MSKISRKEKKKYYNTRRNHIDLHKMLKHHSVVHLCEKGKYR
jgi:hypothetical protein